MIKHFGNDCSGSSFIIQVLETFAVTGYKNNNVCPIERRKSLKREDY